MRRGVLLVVLVISCCIGFGASVEEEEQDRSFYQKVGDVANGIYTRDLSWDVQSAANSAASSVQSAAEGVANSMQPVVDRATNTLQSAANSAQLLAGSASNSIQTAAGSAADMAKDAANGISSAVGNLPPLPSIDDFKNSLQQLTAYKIAKCVYEKKFGMVTVVQLVETGLDKSSIELANLLNIDESTARSIIKITVISATGAVVVYYVIPTVLPVIGFTMEGVAANTMASYIQSIVYKGETSGLFSMLQSAGALGISDTTRVVLSVFGGFAGAGTDAVFTVVG